MATDKILAVADGVIGAITINNPERHNAVSQEMWEAIAACVERFEEDAAIRVISITGAGGKAFASGADISRFAGDRVRGAGTIQRGGAFERACAALQGATKPTVAIINGWCLGGGMALAVSCDLRLASEDARFGIPAARLSIGYGVGGLRRIVELVGLSAAKEIMFTARRYTAAEALRMGLVNQMVPLAELVGFARAYIGEIADNAPLTIRAAKLALTELAKDAGERDWTATNLAVGLCSGSADHLEGAQAFMEKRKANFRGV